MNNLENSVARMIAPAKKSYTLPTDQVNTAAISVTVANNWVNRPEFADLVLKQITAADFLALSTRLATNISQKRTFIKQYSMHTKSVLVLSKEIKENGQVLKGYLFETFKKDAIQYYTMFGYTHKNKSYSLPTDYDNLLQSVRTICDQINTPTYAFLVSKTYGKAYWETTRDRFTTDWTASRTYISDLAALTQAIATDYAEVRKILTLLRRRVKDDYAPQHESHLRMIGFLKESF